MGAHFLAGAALLTFLVGQTGGHSAAQTHGKVGVQRRYHYYYYDLRLIPGVHSLKARVGANLRFNTTYRQSASTGYRWHGPVVTGDKVVGSVREEFIKAADYETKKREADKLPPMPGRPTPDLDWNYTWIKLSKPGKATITFIFSRSAPNEPRQEGDKVCTFNLTVLRRK